MGIRSSGGKTIDFSTTKEDTLLLSGHVCRAGYDRKMVGLESSEQVLIQLFKEKGGSNGVCRWKHLNLTETG